ncbi:hypothetical protein TPAR_06995 [Tolypocladium paradoxum]|uniref:Uncharacterized protein n=1 Tax=Tolypocladium paradoxum TaxID=94208 RepID=A0A2S4KRK7_9HYPO|nr:hypothetical protein TPAR_06995 [Tolypocladium paradoxum]
MPELVASWRLCLRQSTRTPSLVPRPLPLGPGAPPPPPSRPHLASRTTLKSFRQPKPLSDHHSNLGAHQPETLRCCTFIARLSSRCQLVESWLTVSFDNVGSTSELTDQPRPTTDGRRTSAFAAVLALDLPIHSPVFPHLTAQHSFLVTASCARERFTIMSAPCDIEVAPIRTFTTVREFALRHMQGTDDEYEFESTRVKRFNKALGKHEAQYIRPLSTDDDSTCGHVFRVCIEESEELFPGGEQVCKFRLRYKQHTSEWHNAEQVIEKEPLEEGWREFHVSEVATSGWTGTERNEPISMSAECQDGVRD